MQLVTHSLLRIKRELRRVVWLFWVHTWTIRDGHFKPQEMYFSRHWVPSKMAQKFVSVSKLFFLDSRNKLLPLFLVHESQLRVAWPQSREDGLHNNRRPFRKWTSAWHLNVLRPFKETGSPNLKPVGLQLAPESGALTELVNISNRRTVRKNRQRTPFYNIKGGLETFQRSAPWPSGLNTSATSHVLPFSGLIRKDWSKRPVMTKGSGQPLNLLRVP